MRKNSCLGFLLAFVLGLSASFGQRNSYPQGYFQFPIFPGQANTLAGVLGDLRSNHFHGGIDVRTRQVEGLPVRAAADGYVFRVSVQPSGYGNMIIIRHPNGFSTLYGHLKVFGDSLATYVRKQQYAKQTFALDLYPDSAQFRVKKGDLIALSGNTGSSAGPHLHFEVRDWNNNYVNPLFFDFPEITDNTAPAFQSLALRPMNIDSRVGGQFERQVFKPLFTKGRGVHLKDTIRATGSVGIELEAFDRMDGTSFRYGLYCIEILVDDREIFVYNMEKFPNTVTRDYNYLIDYEERLSSGGRFYRCYDPEGNDFKLYRTDEYRGQLQINDTLAHRVTIKIYDSHNNSSTMDFVIKGERNNTYPEIRSETLPTDLQATADRNVLKVTAENYVGPNPVLSVYEKGRLINSEASYKSGNSTVFLLDLKKISPDSVRLKNKALVLNYKSPIPPARGVDFLSDFYSVHFDSTSLFDSLYLTVRESGNTLKINDAGIPLKSSVGVVFQPAGRFTVKERTHIYRFNNGNSFVGGDWEGDRIRFTTRELGSFYPMTDTIPPRIRLLESSPGSIRAVISDNLSGISGFRAEVNGAWVLMNYEPKQNLIWSEKLDVAAPFGGILKLEVSDRAGNIAQIEQEVKELPTRSVRKKKK